MYLIQGLYHEMSIVLNFDETMELKVLACSFEHIYQF
jgi:hypothetical protein